jgi:aminoglycoside phosphotransferase
MMPKDIYLQPDAPDPVLSDDLVLALARRHVAGVRAVTGVDDSGGEARAYTIDDAIVVKVQRPHRLRPRTSLEREVFFLNQLAADPAMPVPRVLGYGREGSVEYTCLTRMPGVALVHARLSNPARRAVLAAVGRSLRRIHQLPQAPFLASNLFPSDQTFAGVRARLAELFEETIALIHSQKRAWSLPLTPEAVSDRALSALPDTAELVALHSNPAQTHAFVDPATGQYTGLIDFGDAYISHPALDLWRWRDPADRPALLAGYTAESPVDDTFLRVWQITQILADLILIAQHPERAPEPRADLAQLLAEL